MKVSVIGAGYVGLVVSAGLADAGHQVLCVDSNPERIASLKTGKSPFFEPGLQELIEINAKRLSFSNSLEAAIETSELLILAVNTPERPEEQVDLTSCFEILKQISNTAQKPKWIMVKNTVPLGSCQKFKSYLREHSTLNHQIIHNPEFLRQGSAVQDFLKPDRIVLGVESEESKALMKELYSPLLESTSCPILHMDFASSELVKYAANSFLALKISFINEMALLSDKVGADIDKIREGIGSDHRINPHFFAPGIGYGGSCFSKDIQSLIHTGKDFDLDLKVLKACEDVNTRQKGILVERLKLKLGNLQGLRIGILGLSFKPKTDDLRRAPSVEVIEELKKEGALVQAFDPVAFHSKVEMMSSAEEVANGADAILILTEWPEFKSLNLERMKVRMKTPLVFDGRNLFDPKIMKSLGFEYICIGKRA